jgi:autotransporter-associated beta strand protein
MQRKVHGFLVGSIFLAGTWCGLSNGVQAQQVFNWTNGGGNLAWTNSANWDIGSSYPGKLSTTDTAAFPAGSPTGTINIGSPVTLGVMSLGNNSAGNTIAGSAISLSNGGSIIMTNINNQGLNNVISAPVALLGSGTIENDNLSSTSYWTGRLSITGSLSGAGALTIATTNGGLVELAGNNSGYTGAISVVSTTPNLGGLFGGTIGGASALNFTNGSWRGYAAGTSSPITINAGATFFDWAGSMNSNITINSGGTLTLGTGGGNQNVYYGAISGGGVVAAAGNGNIYSGWTDNWFAGASPNTITGSVNVQSGRLYLDKTAGVNAIGTAGVNVGSSGNTALVIWQANNQINGTAPITLLSAGNLTDSGGTMNSGQLWLNGHNDTIAGLQDTGGSGTAIVENDATTTISALTLSPSAGSTYSYGGRIRDASGPGLGTLTLGLSGAGRQILSGAITYSGATTINGGTLTLNGSKSNANIQVNSGTFNGSGLITFQPNNEIIVGSTGKFDASSGSWNIAGLSTSPVTLLDFSSGGSFVSPSSGSLNSLLTPASAAKYTLSKVNNSIVATLLAYNDWVVDASGSWSTSGNWLNGIVPNGAGSPANFGDVITAPRTVTVNIPVTLGSMSFNNYNQYTLQSSAGSNNITLNNSGEDPTISVGAGSHAINAGIVLAGNGALDVTITPQGSTLTIAGNISEATPGTGVLNIEAASAGTVILSGTNTFTGGLNVSGGVLTAAGGRALASNIAVNVLQGATFGLSADTDYQTISSLNCQGGNTVVYPNGGTLNVAANGNNTINGLVGSGVVILTASDAGVTQTFLNNGAFTGNLNINNGFINTPQGANYAFGAASGTTTLNNLTWNGIGSTAVNFRFTGTSVNFGDYGGGPTFSGNVAIDPGTVVNWNTGGGNSGAFSGAISGGGIFNFVGGPGGGSFEYSPLYLTGNLANTFTGTMNVIQGTLWLQKTAGVDAIDGPLNIGANSYTAHVILGANQQIDRSVVVTFANNTSDLRLNGFNTSVGGLTSNLGNGLVANFGTSASTLTVATVGTTTFGGSLVNGGTSSLSLMVGGTGSLVLTGSSSYTGDTVVNSGTLVVTNASALPSGANITVGNWTAIPAPIAGANSVPQGAAVVPVPEPDTLALLIAAGSVVVAFGRRWQRRAAGSCRNAG